MDGLGPGDLARDKAPVEGIMGRRLERDRRSAASGGAFSAFFGDAEQKKLFKMPKLDYNKKAKAPDYAEDTRRRRER